MTQQDPADRTADNEHPTYAVLTEFNDGVDLQFEPATREMGEIEQMTRSLNTSSRHAGDRPVSSEAVEVSEDLEPEKGSIIKHGPLITDEIRQQLQHAHRMERSRESTRRSLAIALLLLTGLVVLMAAATTLRLKPEDGVVRLLDLAQSVLLVFGTAVGYYYGRSKD